MIQLLNTNKTKLKYNRNQKSKTRKLGFKNIVKKFPKSSRFPTFPSFQPGLNISTKYVSVRKHTHTARMKKPRKS